MIKPEFFSDEKIAKLPFEARLLFIGLWNFADDCGVHHKNFRKMLGEIFPNDTKIRESQIKKWVELLENLGFLIELQYNGGIFVKIKNWEKHQKVPNPSEKQWIPEDILKEKLESNERLISENSIKDKDKDKEKDKEEEIEKLYILFSSYLFVPKLLEKEFVSELYEKFGFDKTKRLIREFAEGNFRKVQTMREALNPDGTIKPKTKKEEGITIEHRPA